MAILRMITSQFALFLFSSHEHVFWKITKPCISGLPLQHEISQLVLRNKKVTRNHFSFSHWIKKKSKHTNTCCFVQQNPNRAIGILHPQTYGPFQRTVKCRNVSRASQSNAKVLKIICKESKSKGYGQQMQSYPHSLRSPLNIKGLISE